MTAVAERFDVRIEPAVVPLESIGESPGCWNLRDDVHPTIFEPSIVHCSPPDVYNVLSGKQNENTHVNLRGNDVFTEGDPKHDLLLDAMDSPFNHCCPCLTFDADEPCAPFYDQPLPLIESPQEDDERWPRESECPGYRDADDCRPRELECQWWVDAPSVPSSPEGIPSTGSSGNGGDSSEGCLFNFFDQDDDVLRLDEVSRDPPPPIAPAAGADGCCGADPLDSLRSSWGFASPAPQADGGGGGGQAVSGAGFFGYASLFSGGGVGASAATALCFGMGASVKAPPAPPAAAPAWLPGAGKRRRPGAPGDWRYPSPESDDPAVVASLVEGARRGGFPPLHLELVRAIARMALAAGFKLPVGGAPAAASAALAAEPAPTWADRPVRRLVALAGALGAAAAVAEVPPPPAPHPRPSPAQFTSWYARVLERVEEILGSFSSVAATGGGGGGVEGAGAGGWVSPQQLAAAAGLGKVGGATLILHVQQLVQVALGIITPYPAVGGAGWCGGGGAGGDAPSLFAVGFRVEADAVAAFDSALIPCPSALTRGRQAAVGAKALHKLWTTAALVQAPAGAVAAAAAAAPWGGALEFRRAAEEYRQQRWEHQIERERKMQRGAVRGEDRAVAGGCGGGGVQGGDSVPTACSWGAAWA